MAEPDVDLKGLLERNTPGLGHTTSYRLDNVTIEVDLSEIGVVDESLTEGLPVSVNGHFETQERYAQKLWIEDLLKDAVYLPFE